MHAKISAIEYFLPETMLSNEELAKLYVGWSAKKIESKTGIRSRHVASPDQTVTDLGFEAARKLFATGCCTPEHVDFLLFCTESPDYPLPPCACILQDRLKLPHTAGALDYNLACSGFVYGLGLADALIVSGQAQNVLLITAETYSKYIHPDDKNVRTIFGDGAAATLLTTTDIPKLGPFIYGTDGSGFANLIVARGGSCSEKNQARLNLAEKTQYPDHLYMNGPEIFNFTIEAVPKAIDQLLTKARMCLDNIDFFVFHQANTYMLEHLRQKIGIPQEKFFSDMLDTGNTVSASIPIALKKALEQRLINHGEIVLLIGFGVGYSWAATLMEV